MPGQVLHSDCLDGGEMDSSHKAKIRKKEVSEAHQPILRKLFFQRDFRSILS
jgi:hypothetical protein